MGWDGMGWDGMGWGWMGQVERLVFQLVCDSAGEVVEESLGGLVPAFVSWTKSRQHPLSHMLRSLLQQMLANIKVPPPPLPPPTVPHKNTRGPTSCLPYAGLPGCVFR